MPLHRDVKDIYKCSTCRNIHQKNLDKGAIE
jgi:hypothetical protein